MNTTLIKENFLNYFLNFNFENVNVSLIVPDFETDFNFAASSENQSSVVSQRLAEKSQLIEPPPIIDDPPLINPPGEVDEGETINNVVPNTIIQTKSGPDSIINNADADNVFISTSEGSDTIRNYAGASTINAGNGNDLIENIRSGEDLPDWSYYRGSKNTLLSGSGDDTIINGGSYVYIDAGEGNDEINSSQSFGSTILANAGSDNVTGSFTKAFIDTGQGNDSIDSWISESTILGGEGDDLIKISGNSENYISGGAGHDKISVKAAEIYGAYDKKNVTTIRGSTGNDEIFNDSTTDGSVKILNVYQYANGDGNDTIYGLNSDDTIEIEEDCKISSSVARAKDYVFNFEDKDSITINDGIGKGAWVKIGSREAKYFTFCDLPDDENEIINNTDSNISIKTSDGNDKITNSGANVTILSSDGDDTIENKNSKNVSINGGAGTDLIKISLSNYVTVKGNEGNDTIKNDHYNRNLLDGGSDDDYIENSGSYTSLIGGTGNDSLLIANPYAYITTVIGGEGDDFIKAYGGFIDGGEGADRISLGSHFEWINHAYGATINGGTGDDVIFGESSAAHVYTYTFGDGDDTIYGFNSDDTITVSGGKVSMETIGNNVRIDVKGNNPSQNGSILLVDANKVKNIFPYNPPPPAEKPSPQEVILSLAYYLDNTKESGIAAWNGALNFASGGYFQDHDDFLNKILRDLSNAGTGEKFLEEFASMYIYNEDTGAILGADAGGEKVLNAEDIIPENGSLDNFNENSFTTNGVTFNLSKWTDYDNWISSKISINELTIDQLHLWRAIETWWAKNGLNLIANTYGYRFDQPDVTAKEISIMFVNDPNDASNRVNANYLAVTRWYNDGKGGAKKISITINIKYYNNFKDSDVNGVSPNGQIFCDRVFTHELVHAIMASDVNYYSGLPSYAKEGLCEVVHGGDYRYKFSIIPLVNDPDKLKTALNTSTSYASIPGVASPTYGAGIIGTRYVAEQGSKHYGETANNQGGESSESTAISDCISIKGTTAIVVEDSLSKVKFSDYPKVTKLDARKSQKPLTIIGNTTADSIMGGSREDFISGNSGNDKIAGNAGDDQLYGDAGNDSISGGDGADTISGGEGDDTLVGGKGADIFIYDGGNDFITDYKADEDKIQLANYENISDAYLNNGVVVLKIGTGSIKIKDAKNKKITIIDTEGNETKFHPAVSPTVSANTLPIGISVKKDVLTASEKFKGEINLSDYEDVTKVNAAAMSQGVIIVGNNNNDLIKGSKFADTISSGNGNDTLTGGAGADVFIYEGGYDLITDYKAGEDKINLDIADVTKSSIKGSDIILTTDKGTLTLKGAKDKVVTFVDENGTTTEKIFFAGISYSPLETGLTYDAKRAVLTASNKYQSTEIDLGDYLSSVTKVNAASAKQALNIVGNGNNDLIKGSKFADTISGGNGNDTLTGGAGADVFIYEGGYDLITDYKAGEDKIKISSGTISKTTYKNKDVVFTIGSGTLTVKNAQGKDISVTTGSQTQTYSQTFDLLYDCNFMNDEFQIDDVSEVTANNYSVGQIHQSSNFQTVETVETFSITSAITFEKK